MNRVGGARAERQCSNTFKSTRVLCMRFVDVNAVFPGLHGLYTEGRPLIMIVVTQLHCEVLQHPFVIICLNFMIILSIIQPFIKINQNKPMLLIIQASIAQMMLFLAGGGGEGQHVLVAAAVDLLDSTQQRLAHACRGAPPPPAYYKKSKLHMAVSCIGRTSEASNKKACLACGCDHQLRR